MKAVQYLGQNTMDLVDVPMLPTRPGEVRLRPTVVGLCGTDTHIRRGEFPSWPPVILGHEIAGIVDEVGRDVQGLQEGDVVAVDPKVSCGVCRWCRRGLAHLCPSKEGFGSRRNGGLAEWMTIPATCAYRVAKAQDPTLVSLVEPLSCCVHALDRLRPNAGEPVLVIGGGLMGCLVLALGALQGFKMVVVEPVWERRELAQSLGAVATYDPADPAWREDALQDVGGEFPSVVEAVGQAEALRTALELVGLGGRICVLGVAASNDAFLMKERVLYDKELTIVGSNTNPFCFDRAIEILPDLGLHRITAAHFGLAEWAEAFEWQATSRVLKVRIFPQVTKINRGNG